MGKPTQGSCAYEKESSGRDETVRSMSVRSKSKVIRGVGRAAFSAQTINIIPQPQYSEAEEIV
jgi:hypothetical protein